MIQSLQTSLFMIREEVTIHVHRGLDRRVT
jgi:hypothetical protein